MTEGARKEFGKAAHFFLIILFAPWVPFVVAGMARGFVVPTSLNEFFAIYAYWFGSAFISILISSIILIIFSRRAAWVALVVLLALRYGYSDDFTAALPVQSGVASPSSSLVDKEGVVPMRVRKSAVKNASTNPSADSSIEPSVVSEQVERHDGLRGIKINSYSIRGLEQSIEGPIFERIKSQGLESAVKLETNTVEISEAGRSVYVTRVTMREVGNEDTSQSIYTVWNVEEDQLKRVNCTFPTPNYPWRRTACGRQVAKTFNWAGWYAPSQP